MKNIGGGGGGGFRAKDYIFAGGRGVAKVLFFFSIQWAVGFCENV